MWVLWGVTLLKRLAALEARVQQNFSNSSRPPLADSLAKKCQRRLPAAEKSGASRVTHLAHPGYSQVLSEPTATVALFADLCACDQRGMVALTPYHTHQVIELPVIRPDVRHWLLHQGQCPSCGQRCKATVPADQVSGYGPRLTGFMGEMAGIVEASRSAAQALCPPPCLKSC